MRSQGVNNNTKPQDQAQVQNEYMDLIIKNVLQDMSAEFKNMPNSKFLQGHYVDFLAYEGKLDQGNFIISIFLINPENMDNKLKKNIERRVKKSLHKIMVKYIKKEMTYSVQFLNCAENVYCQTTTTEVLNQILDNMASILPLTRKNLKDLESMTDENKLFLIRFELVSLVEVLKKDFPNVFNKKKHILSEAILSQCYEITVNIAGKNNNHMSALVDNLTKRIKQYSVGIIAQEEKTIFYWEKIIKIIHESKKSLFEKSCQFQLLAAFMEDYIEEAKVLILKMEKDLNYLMALVKLYKDINQVFDNVSEIDVVRICGSNQLLNLFSVELAQEAIVMIVNNITHLKEAMAHFTSDIIMMDEEMEKIELLQSEVSIVKSAEYTKTQTLVQEIKSNKTNELSESISSPSSSIIANNHCTLFPSQYSLTHQYRNDALIKIKEEEQKERHRKNRKNGQTQPTVLSLPQSLNLQDEENKFTIYISSKDQTKEADVFPLSGKFIYFCCDMQWVKALKAKSDAFQATALLGKVLRRGSLGVNGIKMYGSDFLIVKCKDYPAEHLLCCPFPIETNKLVYLPVEIISHQKYNDYLRNRSLLINHLDRYRNLIKMSVTPLKEELIKEEPTLGFKKN